MRPASSAAAVSAERVLRQDAAPSRLADFRELTKPGITGFVVVMAVASYLVATDGGIEWRVLLGLALGTALTAGGAGALNQAVERDADRLMARTSSRPLPAGRLGTRAAYVFAGVCVAVGAVVLAATTNALTTGLSLATVALYVLVYTPLKRRTVHNTIVGAIPGALPALGGVTAATGALDATGLALFGILYLWQLPHFLALAWLYRDDYRAGGFRMMPGEPGGEVWSARISLASTLLLLVAALLPTGLGATGLLYAAGMVIVGGVFTVPAFAFYAGPSEDRARRLFLASVVYVPAFFVLVALDVLVR